MALLSRLIHCSLTAGLLLISGAIYAESGRADYDLDDDGLIEINDLADLDEIRNNLDGSSLYSSSAGCPAEGCTGFELTADLDFDTNQNGLIDDGDDYWNGGEGWHPLGQLGGEFIATFDGNNYKVLNLYSTRRVSSVGLFGAAKGANFRRLELSGPLTELTELFGAAGLLVGNVRDSIISEVLASGVIRSTGGPGLIAGRASNTRITSCVTSGEVDGLHLAQFLGGVLGFGDSTTSVSAVFSNAQVHSGQNVAGIVAGQTHAVAASLSLANVYDEQYTSGALVAYNSTATDSHWPQSHVVTKGPDRVVLNNSSAASIVDLQCPTTSGNASCANRSLFSSWNNYLNLSGAPVWHMGDEDQLPGLNILNRVIRDSDGDGVFDDGDHWPFDSRIAKDEDRDGYPDQFTWLCSRSCQEASGYPLDQLPESAAAFLDEDFDGRPDAWSSTCNLACQAGSGLTLDAHLGDADNDGITDELDTDDNSDGHVDRDSDSDGLLEISSLEELNAIRFSLKGHGFKDSSDALLDSSGCPVIQVNGTARRQCHGYELTADLDLDINGDGVISSADTYWNGGKGWEPLGGNGQPYSAVFEGNNHRILNLFIANDSYYQGLFGILAGSEVNRIELSGPLTKVHNKSKGGVLAGQVINSELTEILIDGYVTNEDEAGLIAGVFINSEVAGCAVSGAVRAGRTGVAGGVVGESHYGSRITACLSNAKVEAGKSVGGVVASVISDSYVRASLGATNIKVVNRSFFSALSFAGSVENSHWLLDGSKELGVGYLAQHPSGLKSGAAEETASFGASLEQLQCSTSADDRSCSEHLQFKNWGTYVKGDGTPWWDFGDNTQLPGVRILGRVVRDSDGDGALDDLDAWPKDPFVAVDGDADGYPDVFTWRCDHACQAGHYLSLDYFPNNPAAHTDLDGDGLPDSWSSDCDTACQNLSGLTLDLQLGDRDNDGLNDIEDTDDNNDGRTDADADSDGLIDVAVLEELNSIRYQLDGQGQKQSLESIIDTSGCPIISTDQGAQIRCSGYELVADLDFDSYKNGSMDSWDRYWNGGEGWLPLGTVTEPFQATFDGNNHSLLNFYIRREDGYQGLFGVADNATVRRLGMSGTLTSIKNSREVAGLLAGDFLNSTATDIYAAGEVEVEFDAGLLFGKSSNSRVNACVVRGSVKAKHNFSRAGGIVAKGGRSTNVNACLSSVSVSGGLVAGGFVGEYAQQVSRSLSLANHIQVAGRSNYRGAFTGYYGASLDSHWLSNLGDWLGVGALSQGEINSEAESLRQLQCMNPLKSPSCSNATVYSAWQSELNADSQPLWDFGDQTQLPGLNILGRVFRDGDGDGYFDGEDARPLDFDNDGIQDAIDVFPIISIGSELDSDGDGAPNVCLSLCLQRGMTADMDDDNDGVVDAADAFPLDASESVDTDGDGIGNKADTDDDNDGVLDVKDAFPLNVNESLDSDGDGFGNNEDVDDDNDMITDVWEQSHGFDSLDPADGLLDADNDGASNLDEFESGTDPRDADSVPSWMQGGGAWKYYLYKKAAEGATLQ